MKRGSRPSLFLAVIIALSWAQLPQNVSLVDTRSPPPVAIQKAGGLAAFVGCTCLQKRLEPVPSSFLLHLFLLIATVLDEHCTH